MDIKSRNMRLGEYDNVFMPSVHYQIMKIRKNVC